MLDRATGGTGAGRSYGRLEASLAGPPAYASRGRAPRPSNGLCISPAAPSEVAHSSQAALAIDPISICASFLIFNEKFMLFAPPTPTLQASLHVETAILPVFLHLPNFERVSSEPTLAHSLRTEYSSAELHQ